MPTSYSFKHISYVSPLVIEVKSEPQPLFAVKIKKSKFVPSWGIYSSGYSQFLEDKDLKNIEGKFIEEKIKSFYQTQTNNERERITRENERRAQSNWKSEIEAASDK